MSDRDTIYITLAPILQIQHVVRISFIEKLQIPNNIVQTAS